jgi:hypothetical protein
MRDVGLVHVAEQVGGKAPGRGDLGLAMLARVDGQPVRSVVGQQQALVMIQEPAVDARWKEVAKLPCIPDQASPVIAAGELEKGCIEPDDADTARPDR